MQSTTNQFRQTGRKSLYATSSQQYGSPWMQNGQRAQKVNIKTQKVPTYSQIVDSLNDYKKAERLIKSKIIQAKMEELNLNPDDRTMTRAQFPAKDIQKIRYPSHGLNVGPATYRTNNMNYGSSIPQTYQIPNKYKPCNSSFTKGFNGGNYNFNGLNTTKTVSTVHNALNDL